MLHLLAASAALTSGHALIRPPSAAVMAVCPWTAAPACSPHARRSAVQPLCCEKPEQEASTPELRPPPSRSLRETQLNSPIHLKSKRPLGKRHLTYESTRWLGREMRWKARDYLLTLEQETLGFLAISEEAALLHALRHFSMQGLQSHLRMRLAEAAPSTVDGRAGAELIARHPPTIWAAFQLAVQQRLQERCEDGNEIRVTVERKDLGPPSDPKDWQTDLEWLILPQVRNLQLDASAEECARRSLTPVSGKAQAASRPAGPKPRANAKQPAGKQARNAPTSRSAVASGANAGGAGQQVRSGARKKSTPAQGPAVAAAGGKSAPRPNAKQPLGRKEVGSFTLAWLSTATEVLADEYLAFVDQLGTASAQVGVEGADAEKALLEALAPRFGVVPLVHRIDELLALEGDVPAEAREHAERVRLHVPTCWSSFSGAVRSRLQLRYDNDDALGAVQGSDGGSSDGGTTAWAPRETWSSSMPWLLQKALYESAKAERGFQWTLDRREEAPPRGGAMAGGAQADGAQAGGVMAAGEDGEDGEDGAARAARRQREKRQALTAAVTAQALARATLLAAGEAGGGASEGTADGAAATVPAWTRVNAEGKLELLSIPTWEDAGGSLGGEGGDGLEGLSPLPAAAPLEGAEEVVEALRAYTKDALRLLRLERSAALGAAEELLVQLEEEEARALSADAQAAEAAAAAKAKAEAERKAAAASMTLDAAPAADEPTVDEPAADSDADRTAGRKPPTAAEEAAAASAEAAAAAVELATAEEGRMDRAMRMLRSVRLSNVQAVDGEKSGKRTLLTISPGSVDDGRLPRSSLRVGDVVWVRPGAEEASLWPGKARKAGKAGKAGEEKAPADGLRGVVSKSTGSSLVVSLDSGALAREVQMLGGGGAEEAAEEAQAAADDEALARSWLGGQVRVDYLGSDVTFSRNVGALEALHRSGQMALEGKAAPNYAILRALYAGASGDGLKAASAAVGAAPEFAPFDEMLNADQRRAVDAALSGPLPLSIVQGPPGSGKTSMVVELVRRAVLSSGLRVLAVAPSNMAVDGLALRLAAAEPSLRLVRVGDPQRVDAGALSITAEQVASRRSGELEREAEAELQRRIAEVDADEKMGKKRKAVMKQYLRRHTKRMVSKRQARGPLEAMADAQVLLCTTTAAAEKAVRDLPPFDLVVVDEAGQATSPNAWVPLLRGRRGVLIGDPMQLPPTILSREAAAGGLDVTLMESATAKLGAGSHTLLATQYRMHEAISEWSSRQFYNGRLITHPSAAKRLLSELMPTSAGAAAATDAGADADAGEDPLAPPLLTLAVWGGASGRGLETRAAGGAIVNHAEARAVVAHVASLLTAGVPASRIAVISPYSAQVGLIRRQLSKSVAVQRLLTAAAMAAGALEPEAVEVATIDSFQGREADAVVLSLVRSNTRRSIGFLADARRLNVAVTRARRHVAIVCDPSTVRSDPLLDSLLTHCESRGVVRQVEGEGGAGAANARGVVMPVSGSTTSPPLQQPRS